MRQEKIEVTGFDWDGTLVDSMPVKAESFASSVMQFYPQLENVHKEIVTLYLQTRGNPRTLQLGLVQNRYGLLSLDKPRLKKME